MNASEIIRRLKAEPKYCHIPVVVLSGSVNPDVVRKCYQEGASSFIRKPSTVKETDSKINTFIKYWFETVELS